MCFLVRRLIYAVFVIVGITLVLFTIMYKLPADPVKAAAGLHSGKEQVEKIRQQLGMDKPPHIQYLTYVGNLLRGEMGTSLTTRKPVTKELKSALPATLELVLAAMLINLLISFPLGVLSALRPGHVADSSSRFLTALGAGMPIFWVALMGQLLFYGMLDWLPFGGRVPIGTTPPDHVTGFYTVDALLAGDLPLFKTAFVHLIMPAIVLALPMVAVLSRLTRSSMQDVLDEDYVRTARAKGLHEKRVVWLHGFKNAILVPLTMAGMQIGWMLSGTLLVEAVFSWGGLGFLAFTAINDHDFVVIMAVTLIVVLAFVFSNLIIDIVYKYLDPRITY